MTREKKRKTLTFFFSFIFLLIGYFVVAFNRNYLEAKAVVASGWNANPKQNSRKYKNQFRCGVSGMAQCMERSWKKKKLFGQLLMIRKTSAYDKEVARFSSLAAAAYDLPAGAN